MPAFIDEHIINNIILTIFTIQILTIIQTNYSKLRNYQIK